MKKIFALVLAVAMLSSMALAAELDTGLSRVSPDSTLTVGAANFTGLSAKIGVGDFTSDNFNITTKKFSKGSNLVKSVAFNNDDEVIEVKLIQDLNLVAPASTKAPNLVMEKIAVKTKKKIGTASKSEEFVYNATGVQAWVGFSGTTIDLDSSTVAYPDKDIFKYKAGTNGSYATATASGADYYFEGRVYDGDKIYVKANNSVGDDQKAALKAYPDADLRFVNIVTNGLSSNNDIQILADKEEFVYEMVDGKVVKSNLKWSDDDYAWTGKFRSNKNYVISDIELKAAAAADDVVVNPGTGANDVVGVAAALAVISLVAAGAVSLKK